MKEPKKTTKSSKIIKTKKQGSSLTNIKSLSAIEVVDQDLVYVSSPEQVDVDKLINQVLARYKNDSILNDKKEKIKEVSYLGSIIEEYLSCFTLIGYTIEGEKICIFNAKTSKDEAALVDLLRATFIEVVSNRP